MDTVVARYAGEPGKVSQYSRPLADAPGLKGKLSELASQLVAVQSENEAIRGRYLELEYAWQGMIQENKRVHSVNEELRDELSTCQRQSAEKSDTISALEANVSKLEAHRDELIVAAKKAKDELMVEQLGLGKKHVEADLLRRESMNLDMEGRKLREDYDDKVYKLSKAEEARDHFKAELGKLGSQYADLVEKLSFVTMDYQVRTANTLVKNVDGSSELLSSYLNRIYDEQESINSKYSKIGAFQRSRVELASPVDSPLKTKPLSPRSPRSPRAVSPRLSPRGLPLPLPLDPRGLPLPSYMLY